MFNIRNCAIRWLIPDFIYDGNVNVGLSLNICEISSTIIKCQSFDIENEGQGQRV